MTVEIAFCNDCDLMSWRGYLEVHGFFDSLNIPARDSFWLFDPSGSDMALFTHDINHKGPRHNELLEGISSGRFDVLHSAGSYGAKFNAGYKPNRKLVAQGLEYLAKHARVPNIWSNHGDVNNIQNIGGAFPGDHHKGDIPESEIYIIDLLIEHGIKYFWLDRLLVTDDGLPCRIVAEEMCRSGHIIKTFSRFNGVDWAPNGQNLYQQITPERLTRLIELKQDIVLYQHWGCHHTSDRTAYTPTGDALVKESRDALLRLADLYHKGELKVTHLYDLLEKEDRKSLAEEAQRIGAYMVRTEKGKEDIFYYNQYNKHSIGYFQRRIRQLGLSGASALDAGCGVGQWSFAMTGDFHDITGIDYNDTAYKYLTDMTARLRQSSPSFDKGNIESLPYPDKRFDAVICYGVIFCADVERVINEISRVLKPGAEAYICLNADGWYEYLHDERFADSPEEKRIIYVVPLWNATYRRMGGGGLLKPRYSLHL
jgi:SAM-dependent methyltransferase